MFKVMASSFPSPPPLPGDPLPVAIVGAGFSGTIVASLLARSGQYVLLVDGSGKAGKGTAYSTTEPTHLLNVPAGRMSAGTGAPARKSSVSRLAGGQSLLYTQANRLFRPRSSAG